MPGWLSGIKGLVFMAVILLAAVFLLRTVPFPKVFSDPEIRATTLNPILSQDTNSGTAWGVTAQGMEGGKLTLQDGASWGIFNSPVYQADFPFNAAAISWQSARPSGSEVVLELRASADGKQWSEWFRAEPLENIAPDGGALKSQLIVLRGRYLQYSVTLYAADPALPPATGNIQITYIDSSQGPTVTRVQGSAAKRRPGDVSMPPVVSRAAWGSPEPNSSSRWPPSYRDWTKIALHDTVTKNNDPDPAATMRAIWYYHANTLGWGDIGYNYLIDSYGNIYEGRFGGENVTGGHVLPCYNPGSIGVALLGDHRYAPMSDAMASALEALVTAKTYQHNIDPLGSSDFGGNDYDGTYWHRWLNNLFAHRDLSGSCGNNHQDPGDYAYGRMPEFRQVAAGSYMTYGESWIDSSTPQRIKSGDSASISVTVKNKGSATWTRSDMFRLGYRWLRQDGTEAFPAGNIFQRGELPQDVPFGQQVMVNALVVAPTAAGTYTLRLDMVREGVFWFADQGNQALDKTVVVEAPSYIAQFVGQGVNGPLLTEGNTTAWFEVKNTGSATWYRNGSNPLLLGTWSPQDRSSALYTPGVWPAPWRATYLDQDQVAPGQVGRFTFVVTGPSQAGVFREHFSLVAEGKGWFGPDLWIDFNVTAPTYIAEFVGQAESVPMFPGDKRQYYFEVKNTGTATWYRTGANPVNLGTWEPQDRLSGFFTAGLWPAATRAASLEQNQVAPGQNGRFTFTVTGYSQPGLYREHFMLVAEGKTWFGPDMWMEFPVLRSIRSHMPQVVKGNPGGW